MTDARSRRWFLTINNYTEEEVDHACSYKCNYMIIADEIGEIEKTPHLHIYFELKDAKSFSKIKKEFPRANIQIAKGNNAQVREYLTKQKLLYEHGKPSAQGERSDISKAKEQLEQTGKMADVVSIATSYQSVRMCECILKYKERKRRWKPKVEWYYGSTGTNKSKTAYEVLGEDAYTTGKTIKWWEGYDAHEHVIIDDFRKDFCCFHELLKLLDRYPYRVECKGGSREFLATHIIITSAYHPEEIYDTREDIGQLIRRIDNIKIFTNIIKDGENKETNIETKDEF